MRRFKKIGYRLASIISITGVTAGCATTNSLKEGNSLPGVSVTSAGSDVVLNWDPQSRLGGQLRNRAKISLVAAYQTDRGAVTGEPLVSASVDGRVSSLRFSLPDKLRNIPDGPICLRFASQRRAIPVRVPTPTTSSDGFYYTEWANMAGLNAEIEAVNSRERTLGRNIEQLDKNGDGFAEWTRKNNVQDVSQCSTLKATIDYKRPSTALNGDEKHAAARKHCVASFSQVTKLRDQVLDLPDTQSEATSLPERMLALATDIRNALPEGTKLTETADQMIGDIKSHREGISTLKDTTLGLDAAAIRSLSISKGEINAVLSTVIVESYDACISEAERQFDLSYESWISETSGQNLEARSEPLRGECYRRFQTETQRQQQLNELRQQMETTVVEKAALNSTASLPLPTGVDLINSACPIAVD